MTVVPDRTKKTENRGPYKEPKSVYLREGMDKTRMRGLKGEDNLSPPPWEVGGREIERMWK